MVRQALAASAAILFSIASSTGAQAVEQEDLPFADARTYLMAGGSNGIELFDLGADETAGNGVGLHVRFGKRVASHFAVESQIDWIGGFDLSEPSPIGGDRRTGSVDIWTMGLNVKAFLLTDRVQPYMLVGMGGIFVTGNIGFDAVDITGNGFMGRFGVGLDFYATERIGMSIETAYVLPTSSASGFEHITVHWGIFYRFNNEDD